jgi:hypothetical protein
MHAASIILSNRQIKWSRRRVALDFRHLKSEVRVHDFPDREKREVKSVSSVAKFE